METRHSNSNYERRFATGGVELRKNTSDSGFTLRGYAFKFGVTYDMGDFTEEVLRSAFEGTEMSDVRVLDNHHSDKILGRTKSGTARVGIDEVGGWYEVDLPNSPNGENMRVAVERGDTDQSSWGFILRKDGDRIERRNGRIHRQLTGVEVWLDASPVTFPANPDTTVAKRSMEHAGFVERDREQRAETVKADKYDLAWLVGQLSNTIGWSNNFIYDLNYCIENCRMMQGEGLDINPALTQAMADCETAKAAIVEMINSLSDRVKELNSHENRDSGQKVKSRALDDADHRLRQMQLSQ